MNNKHSANRFFVLLLLAVVIIVQSSCGAQPSATEPVMGNPEAELARIDELLEETISGNIAYNAPTSMQLDETVEIEMVLSPSLSPEELEQQIVESGEIVSAPLEITPQMKAVLKALDAEALHIEALHDDPAQIISGSELTEWKWFVTAKKEGPQELILTVYRLVEYDDSEYWRQIESYENTIEVNVTLGQRLARFDWKWIVGLVITAMTIPALGTWIARRSKPKPQGR